MLAADWSGAARGEQRGLWVARYDARRGRVEEVVPRTRLDAAGAVLEAAARDPELVAGLDFAFSLPAWWLADQGIGGAGELWGDVERLEGWLAGCQPPFWGRPGRRRPDLGDRGWRRTELAARPRPRSVFQIGGAGAVGTASLRGMPVLAALRAAGLAVWPFDRWRPPVVVEVWPRLALGSLVKSSAAARAGWVAGRGPSLAPQVAAAAAASADALDAVAAALWLAGRLPRPLPAEPLAAVEGWIDGVPDAPA